MQHLEQEIDRYQMSMFDLESMVDANSYARLVDVFVDAHRTSAKYAPEISEFDQTDLEPEYKTGIMVPFVKHVPVQIEMKFLQEIPIELNGTLLIIGEINHLFVNDDLLESDGFLNLTKGDVVTINGLDAYVKPTQMTRLDYQRPK